MSVTIHEPPLTPTQQVLSMLPRQLGVTLATGGIDIPVTFLPPFGEVFDFFSVLFLLGYWIVFLVRAFRIVRNGHNGPSPPTLRLHP
jgi:hypothetical protein